MKVQDRSYLFIIGYDMEHLQDQDLGYIYADSFLLKLIGQLETAYQGVETAISQDEPMMREHLFRFLDIQQLVNAVGLAFDHEDDFKDNYCALTAGAEPDLGMVNGVLDVRVTTIKPAEPFSQDELDFTNESIEADPAELVEEIAASTDGLIEELQEGLGQEEEMRLSVPPETAEAVASLLEEDGPPGCPVCPGEGEVMGTLGTRTHYRCRDCGMEFSESDDDPAPNPELFSSSIMEEMIKAIRQDPLVGEGSCTSIDEAMEDNEIAKHLAEDGITTVKDALKWAYDQEEMWLEKGLNQRWGADDDPQLEAWREWKAARTKEGR